MGCLQQAGSELGGWGSYVMVLEDGTAKQDRGFVCCGFGLGFTIVTPLMDQFLTR